MPLTRLGLRPIHPLPEGERNRAPQAFERTLTPIFCRTQKICPSPARERVGEKVGG